MSVSFNNIPNGLKSPFFYAEVDNSAAGGGTALMPRLLIAQVNDAAEHESIGKLTLVSSTGLAETIGGAGSMLARMHKVLRANDPMGEIWCVPVRMKTGGAASGQISLEGTVLSTGVLSLYIAGQRVQTTLTKGMKPADAAAAVMLSINSTASLPVIAAAVPDTKGVGEAAVAIVLTAKWKGLSGNDVSLMLNRLGAVNGELTPEGLTVVFTAMAGGAGALDMDEVLAAVGSEAAEFVIHPYSDTASLDAMREWMSDISGRWSYTQQLYGHVYSARRGELGELVTAGRARNDQHVTVAVLESGVPQPVWEFAAAFAGRQAVFISADVARPTQTGELIGINPAPAGERFDLVERESLLGSGLATTYAESDVLRISRAVTTYQRNPYGQVDESYLDSETMHQTAYIVRFLQQRISSKYGRHKLANDGTQFGAGQAIVTPNVIRGELVAAYADLEELGIVENMPMFSKHLIVERDKNNVNRLNIMFPPDYVNQLRIFALLNQFRLQY